MKTILFYALAALGLPAATPAPDTNVIYLPVPPRFLLAAPARVRQVETQELEAEIERCKNLPECRPAELDPAGHWGPVCAGLQLSARVPTNVFTAGQPIDVTVILRNTTTNRIDVPASGLFMFDFTMLNPNNEPLRPNRALWLYYSGPGSTTVPGRRQIKGQVRLGRIFDLGTPGKYTLYAKRPKGNWSEVPETLSGPVPIEILEQTAPRSAH